MRRRCHPFTSWVSPGGNYGSILGGPNPPWGRPVFFSRTGRSNRVRLALAPVSWGLAGGAGEER